MTGYEDIINLPHHQSEKHAHMSNYDRAAQFSPFAALTGYDDAIVETARLTDDEIELSEDAIAELDAKLAEISVHLSEQPQVTVTYFKPDGLKSGGEYLTYTGAIKKIDTFNRVIIFYSGIRISFNNIVSLSI